MPCRPGLDQHRVHIRDAAPRAGRDEARILFRNVAARAEFIRHDARMHVHRVRPAQQSAGAEIGNAIPCLAGLRVVGADEGLTPRGAFTQPLFRGFVQRDGFEPRPAAQSSFCTHDADGAANFKVIERVERMAGCHVNPRGCERLNSSP